MNVLRSQLPEASNPLLAIEYHLDEGLNEALIQLFENSFFIRNFQPIDYEIAQLKPYITEDNAERVITALVSIYNKIIENPGILDWEFRGRINLEEMLICLVYLVLNEIEKQRIAEVKTEEVKPVEPAPVNPLDEFTNLISQATAVAAAAELSLTPLFYDNVTTVLEKDKDLFRPKEEFLNRVKDVLKWLRSRLTEKTPNPKELVQLERLYKIISSDIDENPDYYGQEIIAFKTGISALIEELKKAGVKSGREENIKLLTETYEHLYDLIRLLARIGKQPLYNERNALVEKAEPSRLADNMIKILNILKEEYSEAVVKGLIEKFFPGDSDERIGSFNRYSLIFKQLINLIGGVKREGFKAEKEVKLLISLLNNCYEALRKKGELPDEAAFFREEINKLYSINIQGINVKEAVEGFPLKFYELLSILSESLKHKRFKLKKAQEQFLSRYQSTDFLADLISLIEFLEANNALNPEVRSRINDKDYYNQLSQEVFDRIQRPSEYLVTKEFDINKELFLIVEMINNLYKMLKSREMDELMPKIIKIVNDLPAYYDERRQELESRISSYEEDIKPIQSAVERLVLEREGRIRKADWKKLYERKD